MSKKKEQAPSNEKIMATRYAQIALIYHTRLKPAFEEIISILDKTDILDILVVDDTKDKEPKLS